MSDAEYLKMVKPDLELSVKNGLLVHEGDNFRASPDFGRRLEANLKVRGDLADEELLYGIMLAIREFSPGLTGNDFLAARRAVMAYGVSTRQVWRKNHPDEAPRSLEEHDKMLLDLRRRWAARLKPGEEQDMLTLTCDKQLQLARETIALGGSFHPELIVYRGRQFGVSMAGGDDPMGQAIAAILSSKPDGYSYASEAWKGPMKADYKRGDLAKSESRVETFIQICSENGGPFISRTFLIDRARGKLLRDSYFGKTRMPVFWDVDTSVSHRGEATSAGAYA